MPTCGNCRQEVEFYEHGGLFYCTECETQSQVMRVLEKDDDYDVKLDYAHVYKTTTTRKKKGRDRADDSDVKEVRSWWSCELYQGILKAQVKALIGLGFSPQLDEVVMQLWFRFIKKSKLAFCMASPSRSTAKGMEGFDEEKEEENETEGGSPNVEKLSSNEAKPHGKGRGTSKVSAKDDWLHQTDEGKMTGRNARHSLSGRTRLVLWDSVCFMYLGLRSLQEPVLLSDLLGLVREGRLPLRATGDVIPDHIAMNMSSKDINRYCNTQMSIPDITIIVGLVTKLSEKLQFTPFHSLQLDLCFTIARLVSMLNLPAELCSLVYQLHLWAQTFLASSSGNPHDKSPRMKSDLEIPAVECQALAYIIIALKLLLTLDDKSEHTLSVRTSNLQPLFPAGVVLFNWDAWVAAQKLRVQDRVSREGSVNSSSDINKVRNMDGFLHHFKSFYRVEEINKHFHNRKHKLTGRQDILKEFQRPFRALHEESSASQDPSFLSTDTMSQLGQRLDASECGSDGNNDDLNETEVDPQKPTASFKWLPRRYLLREDFSKHTLKHLTNLQDLCEQYIIPPELVRRALDSVGKKNKFNDKSETTESEWNKLRTSNSEDPSSVGECSEGSSVRASKRKGDDVEKCSKKKNGPKADKKKKGSARKTQENLKELHIDDQNRLYLTYPGLGRRRPGVLHLEHQMDCFHMSVGWLLGHCSQLCETRPKGLYCYVRDIEKVLFKGDVQQE